jgi:serine/threonine-protein kinase
VTAEQWQRIKPILESALELDGTKQAAFLDRACADPVLRREIESLLAVQEQSRLFMENPVLGESLLTTGLADTENTNRQDKQNPISSVPLTTSYLHEAGDAGRLYLQLGGGPGSAHSLEIRELLRRRLLSVVLIALGVNGIFNALRLMGLQSVFDTATVWELWVPAAINLIALVVLAIILTRKQIYTLTQLRWLEVATFAITSLYFLGETYRPLFGSSEGLMISYAQRHASEMSILARLPSIMWIALIVGYGMFIPNTGRRCAAMSAAMALSPIILVATVGVIHPAVPRRMLALYLAEMAMWMGCAVAMAIYGSHKITVLRQEALVARKLGQYDLKQRLGQGGMGEVYLAEHVLLKRPCAVKLIRPDQTANTSTMQRFLREVQVTATLTHPNTVQIFDYGQTDDGTVFYAMEYLPGLNLEQLVGRYGPLPPPRVIYVVRQLCGALAEAHTVGLIHRDIKPGNVILCSRGGMCDIAKLLDFGLVRLQSTELAGSGLTQDGLIYGTPAYMSPEQASGKKELDARSDIYSLGALIWFLSVGEPPFVREGVIQTLAAHISEPVSPLRSRCPDFPEDLDKVAQRCLAKDPEQRFPDVKSLEEALVMCSEVRAWTQMEAAAWWNKIPNAYQSPQVESA